MFVLFLAITLVIQIALGAYRTEAGNYPDEAAHLMNGLLVRDYLTSGLGQNPIQFAERYYLNYPKIAPMMWPPLFHLVEGLSLLPGWPPHGAALALLALITAWTCWRLYRFVLLISSRVPALLVSGLFLFTPAIIEMTTAVMIDIVVAALALEATYWVARFFGSGSNRHAVLFGLFAAACCLTKGNGVSIVLVPVFLLLFTRRFDLLRRPGLYMAAAMVIALAVPLLLVSYRLDAAIGDFAVVTAATGVERVGFYSSYLQRQIGGIALGLSVIGVLEAVRRRSGRSADAIPAPEALASLVCAAFAFHTLNPHREIDGRYMTLAVAPLLGLLPFAVGRIGALAQSRPARQGAHSALFGLALTAFVAAPTAFARRQPLGFSAVADVLADCGELADRRILIVSDADGEGAFISDVAARQLSPAPTIVRGTKLLARIDWPGSHLQLLFPSATAVMQELLNLHIRYLVVDSSSAANAFLYGPQIQELIASNPDQLIRIYSTAVRGSGVGRPITLYSLTDHPAGSTKTLKIDLRSLIGRVLQQ